ncbi:MAG: hypothetical protein ACT4OX_15605 [Actinomycetota bacterium]
MTGNRVIDPHGEIVGTVTDVFSDDHSLRPEWAVVSYGVFNQHHRVVPVARMYESADEDICVDFEKEIVRHAPKIGAHEPLTGELERELAEYYGRN